MTSEFEEPDLFPNSYESDSEDSSTDDGSDESSSEDEDSNDDVESNNEELKETDKAVVLMNENSSESNEDTESCPICLNRFIGQDLGSPENCNHIFCLECVLEWSKNINTCPIDRTEFNFIRVNPTHDGKAAEMVQVEVVPRDVEFELPEDITTCEVCQMGDREDRLLLCDGCDLAYHCECLSPPLRSIPIEEWFCPPCSGVFEVTGSHSGLGRQRRVIPRTRVSESVRSRIENIRSFQSSGSRNATASSIVRKKSYAPRKAPKRRRRKRRFYTKVIKYARTKQSLMDGTKGKVSSRNVVLIKCKTKRRRRKIRAKKGKSATKSKKITAKKHIATVLGLGRPLDGHTMPSVKRSASSSKTSHQTSHSLFGNRNQLMDFSDSDDISNSKASSSSTVSSSLATSTISSTPFNILDSIMAGQELLHKKSKDIVIQNDGSLILKKEKDVKKNPKPKPEIKESVRNPKHLALKKQIVENVQNSKANSVSKKHSNLSSKENELMPKKVKVESEMVSDVKRESHHIDSSNFSLTGARPKTSYTSVNHSKESSSACSTGTKQRNKSSGNAHDASKRSEKRRVFNGFYYSNHQSSNTEPENTLSDIKFSTLTNLSCNTEENVNVNIENEESLEFFSQECNGRSNTLHCGHDFDEKDKMLAKRKKTSLREKAMKCENTLGVNKLNDISQFQRAESAKKQANATAKNISNFSNNHLNNDSVILPSKQYKISEIPHASTHHPKFHIKKEIFSDDESEFPKMEKKYFAEDYNQNQSAINPRFTLRNNPAKFLSNHNIIADNNISHTEKQMFFSEDGEDANLRMQPLNETIVSNKFQSKLQYKQALVKRENVFDELPCTQLCEVAEDTPVPSVYFKDGSSSKNLRMQPLNETIVSNEFQSKLQNKQALVKKENIFDELPCTQLCEIAEDAPLPSVYFKDGSSSFKQNNLHLVNMFNKSNTESAKNLTAQQSQLSLLRTSSTIKQNVNFEEIMPANDINSGRGLSLENPFDDFLETQKAEYPETLPNNISLNEKRRVIPDCRSSVSDVSCDMINKQNLAKIKHENDSTDDEIDLPKTQLVNFSKNKLSPTTEANNSIEDSLENFFTYLPPTQVFQLPKHETTRKRKDADTCELFEEFPSTQKAIYLEKGSHQKLNATDLSMKYSRSISPTEVFPETEVFKSSKHDLNESKNYFDSKNKDSCYISGEELQPTQAIEFLKPTSYSFSEKSSVNKSSRESHKTQNQKDRENSSFIKKMRIGEIKYLEKPDEKKKEIELNVSELPTKQDIFVPDNENIASKKRVECDNFETLFDDLPSTQAVQIKKCNPQKLSERESFESSAQIILKSNTDISIKKRERSKGNEPAKYSNESNGDYIEHYFKSVSKESTPQTNQTCFKSTMGNWDKSHTREEVKFDSKETHDPEQISNQTCNKQQSYLDDKLSSIQVSKENSVKSLFPLKIPLTTEQYSNINGGNKLTSKTAIHKNLPSVIVNAPSRVQPKPKHLMLKQSQFNGIDESKNRESPFLKIKVHDSQNNKMIPKAITKQKDTSSKKVDAKHASCDFMNQTNTRHSNVQEILKSEKVDYNQVFLASTRNKIPSDFIPEADNLDQISNSSTLPQIQKTVFKNFEVTDSVPTQKVQNDIKEKKNLENNVINDIDNEIFPATQLAYQPSKSQIPSRGTKTKSIEKTFNLKTNACNKVSNNNPVKNKEEHNKLNQGALLCKNKEQLNTNKHRKGNFNADFNLSNLVLDDYSKREIKSEYASSPSNHAIDEKPKNIQIGRTDFNKIERLKSDTTSNVVSGGEQFCGTVKIKQEVLSDDEAEIGAGYTSENCLNDLLNKSTNSNTFSKKDNGIKEECEETERKKNTVSNEDQYEQNTYSLHGIHVKEEVISDDESVLNSARADVTEIMEPVLKKIKTEHLHFEETDVSVSLGANVIKNEVKHKLHVSPKRNDSKVNDISNSSKHKHNVDKSTLFDHKRECVDGYMHHNEQFISVNDPFKAQKNSSFDTTEKRNFVLNSNNSPTSQNKTMERLKISLKAKSSNAHKSAISSEDKKSSHHEYKSGTKDQHSSKLKTCDLNMKKSSIDHALVNKSRDLKLKTFDKNHDSHHSKHIKVSRGQSLKDRIEAEVKGILKPFYTSQLISKEDYKDIMRRAVPKIYQNCGNVIHQEKIKKLVHSYISLLSNS